eukprot:2168505-Prymnesium_polylepis.1
MSTRTSTHPGGAHDIRGRFATAYRVMLAAQTEPATAAARRAYCARRSLTSTATMTHRNAC